MKTFGMYALVLAMLVGAVFLLSNYTESDPLWQKSNVVGYGVVFRHNTLQCVSYRAEASDLTSNTKALLYFAEEFGKDKLGGGDAHRSRDCQAADGSYAVCVVVCKKDAPE